MSTTTRPDYFLQDRDVKVKVKVGVFVLSLLMDGLHKECAS